MSGSEVGKGTALYDDVGVGDVDEDNDDDDNVGVDDDDAIAIMLLLLTAVLLENMEKDMIEYVYILL
jgi:hypothetical protein